jgi:hypothetical protein
MRLALCLLLLPLPALAETMTREAASGILFPPDAIEIARAGDALSSEQAELLAAAAAGQPYYGAVAVSPDEGLLAEATVAVVNHHTVAAAQTEALAECNRRKTGASPCEIAAVIRPEGWTDRALTLSAPMTAALAAAAPGDAFWAISPATGAWGGGTTAELAIDGCATADCVVVIAP